MKYQHIIGEVFNKPLLVTPALMYDAVVFAKSKLGLNISGFGAVEGGLVGYGDEGERDDSAVCANGLAVIAVHGPLVPRTGNLQMCSRMTAYDSIRHEFLEAINNPDCKAVVLDIDSPGGSCTGAFELAETIYANRGDKPIYAVVNFNAYSAGYLIASACDKIIVSETGGVGSIGVIMQHFDFSKMLDEDGIKVTTLYRGDNKANCSPYEQLTPQALADCNESLDMYYGKFCGFVAKARGLTVDQVIATQAGCFYGQAAIDKGLADELEQPQDAVNKIAASVYEDQATNANDGNNLNMRLRIAKAKQ